MPLNPTELIDHLDDHLRGKGIARKDLLIQSDPETAQEWRNLQTAVDAVQTAALFDQIGAVRSAWKAGQTVNTGQVRLGESEQQQPSRGVVRNISKNVRRVAAGLLVIAGGAAVFKYTTTSSTGLYNKNYTTYTLNSNRGAAASDALEQAYRDRLWQEVVRDFGNLPVRDNKAYFLTGIADMELKKYDEAVEKLEQVLAANLQHGSDYFQDEAEYYLAMSCLARNDVNEAIPLLDKIRANKNHLFHDRVMQMSTLDLRIAQYKNAK